MRSAVAGLLQKQKELEAFPTPNTFVLYFVLLKAIC